jgi:hypothetical protein
MSDLERLIGKAVTDAEVKALVGDDEPVMDQFAEMTIMEYPERGIAVYADKHGKVVTIFLYGDRDEEHEPYKGILPRGLSFAFGRERVAESLGPAHVKGKDQSSQAPWERYDSRDASLHIQYSRDGRSISLITLMSAAMAHGGQ